MHSRHDYVAMIMSVAYSQFRGFGAYVPPLLCLLQAAGRRGCWDRGGHLRLRL
eukprot:SAG31_NODE_9764_length_1230_cov_2.448276_2_plen_52_part_01